MSRRHNLWKLLPTTEELLPHQFYKTAETKPKTALGPMLGFTMIAYLAVLISFILLIIYSSSTYTKEVTIMPEDMTGMDGYTCQMISKVTNSYSTNSVTDPTTSYYLINIIESKDQCLSDLAITDPCSTPQSYIAGETSPVDFGNLLFTALGLYGNDTAYMFASYGYPTIYNYSDGTLIGTENSDDNLDFPVTSNFFGIDATGNIYYLIRGAGCFSVTCVVQFTPTPPFASKLITGYNTSYNGIINDNQYNLYMYDNTTLYAVDYTTAVPTQTLLLQFDIPQGDTLVGVAVHKVADQSPTVFYGICKISYNIVRFFQSVGDVIQVLGEIEGIINTPFVTDGKKLYFTGEQVGDYSAVYFVEVDQNSFMFVPGSFMAAPTTYQGIAISADGTRLLTTSTSNTKQTDNQFFYYPPTDNWEVISYQYNFAAAWFTCGNQIIPSVPPRTSTYTAECSKNGIVGEVLYQKDKTYVFTPTDAAAYALRNSAPSCPAIYNQVCITVADLPPYSCTKKVYPTVFTVLGTAYANTMLLLSILIFVFSMSLTRMAKYYPPPGTNVHGTGGQKRNTVSGDVEMGGGGVKESTSNPISADR